MDDEYLFFDEVPRCEAPVLLVRLVVDVVAVHSFSQRDVLVVSQVLVPLDLLWYSHGFE